MSDGSMDAGKMRITTPERESAVSATGAKRSDLQTFNVSELHALKGQAERLECPYPLEWIEEELRLRAQQVVPSPDARDDAPLRLNQPILSQIAQEGALQRGFPLASDIPGMKTRTVRLDGGKYEYDLLDGRVVATRHHGVDWPASFEDRFSKSIVAMLNRIADLEEVRDASAQLLAWVEEHYKERAMQERVVSPEIAELRRLLVLVTR